MNILYATDRHFVPQVCASICSVFENNRDEKNIHIYVLGLDIDDTDIQRMDALVNRYGRRFTLISLEAIEQYYPFDIDTSGWRPIVLARLLMGALLPKEVHRILYLDGDTIVRGALRPLFQMNMGGRPLAGCQEPTCSHKRLKALGMEGIPYINSGVLLVDMDVWRAEQTGEAIIRFFAEKGGALFAPDQDAINGALKGNIYLLPLSFNYCSTYDYYPYWVLKKIAMPAPFMDRADYDTCINEPVIIHYLGEERPWRKGNRHRYRMDYLKYLQLTPFKDTPMEEGWETYFKLFGLFNTLVSPFPLLRYRIINGLIPSFIRWRKRSIKRHS